MNERSGLVQWGRAVGSDINYTIRALAWNNDGSYEVKWTVTVNSLIHEQLPSCFTFFALCILVVVVSRVIKLIKLLMLLSVLSSRKEFTHYSSS